MTVVGPEYMAKVTPDDASRAYIGLKIVLYFGLAGAFIVSGPIAWFFGGLLVALSAVYKYRQADQVLDGRLPGTGKKWPWEDRRY